MTAVIYESAVSALLIDPLGPVGRELARRGALVATEARQLCPVGNRRPDWRGHIDTTPHLRDTISEEPPEMHNGSLAVLIAARSPYAVYVHEGTRPHDISPHGEVLRFEITVGEVVYTPHPVHHPGTTGRPFLKEALLAAGH